MDKLFKKMDPEQIEIKSIRIVFKKCPSIDYEEVVSIVDSLSSDFKRSLINKTHYIEFLPEALKENYEKIYELLSDIDYWKGTNVYINGKCFKNNKLNLILNTLKCIKRRPRSYSCDEYCNKNSLGLCRQLLGLKGHKYDPSYIEELENKRLYDLLSEEDQDLIDCAMSEKILRTEKFYKWEDVKKEHSSNHYNNKMNRNTRNMYGRKRQKIFASLMCPYLDMDVFRAKSISGIPIAPKYDLSVFRVQRKD